jgi:hypothetical protein
MELRVDDQDMSDRGKVGDCYLARCNVCVEPCTARVVSLAVPPTRMRALLTSTCQPCRLGSSDGVICLPDDWWLTGYAVPCRWEVIGLSRDAGLEAVGGGVSSNVCQTFGDAEGVRNVT